MAIRFTIQGVEYTADTTGEAAELTKALGRQHSAQKAAATRWNGGGGPAPSKRDKQKLSLNRVFNTLLHADKHELHASALAEREGVTEKSIPPLMAGARWWIRATVGQDANFDEYLQKRMGASGETIYSLTERGVDLARNAQK